MATKKRRKPREHWHGTVNGYTNRKCRCKPCKAAFAEYMAEYRAKRFAPGTVCKTKGCKRDPYKPAGNGFCYRCDLERLANAA